MEYHTNEAPNQDLQHYIEYLERTIEELKAEIRDLKGHLEYERRSL